MSSLVLSTMAVVSGVSPFFYGVMILAVVAGVGVLIFGPGPARGLGIGLIVGAAIICLVVLTGPVKH